MKLIIITLFFAFTSFSLFAGSDYGLHFKSKEYAKEYRTGIDITSSGLIYYKNSIDLKFSMSFRYLNFRYGYIFRLTDESHKNEISLICNFPDLVIINNYNETSIKFTLTKEQERLMNRWYTFNLKIDTDQNKVSLSFNGETLEDSLTFSSKSKLAATFGVVNKYGFTNNEVPPISVKDIFIKTEGHHYYWPMNKAEGDSEKDLFEGKVCEIKNPEWQINYHLNWRKLKSFTLKEKPQIAFDKESELIYFVHDNGEFKTYDLNTESLEDFTPKSGYPMSEYAQQMIVDDQGNLITYSFNESKTSKFIKDENRWTVSQPTKAGLPNYWHHNRLINPVNNQITTIGGYGYFKYKNLVQSFDSESNKWETLNFDEGNPIIPRYLSAIGGSSLNDSVYYLFGGTGNVSGKQILGNQFFYDLYKIDFSENKISKLWNLDLESTDLVPVNSMIMKDDDNEFYVMCHSYNKNNTYLQVYEGNLSSPEFTSIGDSIPYYFIDTQSFADLYYWNSANSLVCLTMDYKDEVEYTINLYTINFPPVNKELHANTLPGHKNRLRIIFIVIAVLMLAGLLIYLFVYRKGRSQQPPISSVTPVKEIKEQGEVVKVKEEHSRSIYLFGGFQVFDANERDITYRFSPTLKELFVLILLYSVEGKKGISSKRIQEIIWPDKSETSAKNNRGVNIKKLRSILEDVGNIKIVYEGGFWKIIADKDIYCDILDVWYILPETKENPEISDETKEVLQALKRGNLLINTETEWLDKIKEEVTSMVVDTLEKLSNNLNVSSDSEILMEIVNIILDFDKVNETALKIKCKILIDHGQHSLAMDTYSNFVKYYRNIYNEEFPTPFNQLVKM